MLPLTLSPPTSQLPSSPLSRPSLPSSSAHLCPLWPRSLVRPFTPPCSLSTATRHTASRQCAAPTCAVLFTARRWLRRAVCRQSREGVGSPSDLSALPELGGWSARRPVRDRSVLPYFASEQYCSQPAMLSRPASSCAMTASLPHAASGEPDTTAGDWALAAVVNARATKDWLSLPHSPHSHAYATTGVPYHRGATDSPQLPSWSTALPLPFDTREGLRWLVAPTDAAGDISAEDWSWAQHGRATVLDENGFSPITSTPASHSLFGGSDSQRTKAARRQYAPLLPAASMRLSLRSLPPTPSLCRPTWLCEQSSVAELPLPSLCEAPVIAALPLPSPLAPSSPLIAASQLLDGAALSLSPLPLDFTATAGTVVGRPPSTSLWTVAPPPSSSPSPLPSQPSDSLAVPWIWASTLSPGTFALSPIPVLPPAADWSGKPRSAGDLFSYSSDGDGSSGSSNTGSVADDAATIGVAVRSCSAQHEAEQLSVRVFPPLVDMQPALVQHPQWPSGPVSGISELGTPQRQTSMNCHQCKHTKVGNSYKCQRSEQNRTADAPGGNTKLCKKRYCESATQSTTAHNTALAVRYSEHGSTARHGIEPLFAFGPSV